MVRRALTIEKEGDCLVVTSHTPNKDGYIRMFKGKDAQPRCEFYHRTVWQNVVGPIPEGYEVDHKCRNRRCCNIEHLQLLTRSEHKTKTNKERYEDRIEGVCFALQEGYPIKAIAEAFGVSCHAVRWHKRRMNIGT
jgi:hypothetical protein